MLQLRPGSRLIARTLLASALVVVCSSAARSGESPTIGSAPPPAGATPATAPSGDREAGAPQPNAPSEGEVILPAGPGWNASLVIDNGATGIWTVKAFQVWPSTGCLEVVGIDDKGRMHVLAPYSGRWNAFDTISDGKWLGGLDMADVDPRIPGREIYAGSQNGNLYQVVTYPHGTFLDNRLIAVLPGREIHTIVAGDYDPSSPGPELIVFTRPGGLYVSRPSGPNGTFDTRFVGDVPSRIRDAIEMPRREGAPPEIATVGHAGRLELLHFTKDGPAWETVYECAVGIGRVALKPDSPPDAPVLYTTRDDGVISRHERSRGGDWKSEAIYYGPLGPRGIAPGPFDLDPTVETVAVFGYSRKVEILTRGATGWTAETAFEDREKGHWLASAEFDGRNGTREILLTGYGGRIVMLARAPGFGVHGLAAPR